MFRRKTLIIAALMLAWTGMATAALDRIEEAYELGLDEVRLPAHSSGHVVVRQCSGCEAMMLPVSERTVYRLSNSPQAVSLQDFRQAAEAADSGAVYVFYATDTGVVNRIVLSVTS